MKLDEAKKRFIGEWGTFGSQWGVNRTMAQAHALLMVSANPLSADEVMEQLNISRGNANMNLRALIDWGLIKKTHISGERKEFFVAEKNIWKVTRQVIKERKRRELEPLINMIAELKADVEVDSDEANEFQKMMEELEQFATAADTTLDKLVDSDRQWLFNSLLKFMGNK